MAIRRTREQKQRAVERRQELYVLEEQREDKTPATQSALVEKPKPVSVFDAGLTRHRETTAAYLKQDLGRIVLTTIALFVILVGIWYGTRYNGVSLF